MIKNYVFILVDFFFSPSLYFGLNGDLRPVETYKQSTNSCMILSALDNLIVQDTKTGPLISGSPLITTSICPLNFKCPVTQQAPTNYVSDTFEGSKNQDLAIVCVVCVSFFFYSQPFPSASAQNNGTNTISHWHILSYDSVRQNSAEMKHQSWSLTSPAPLRPRAVGLLSESSHAASFCVPLCLRDIWQRTKAF